MPVQYAVIGSNYRSLRIVHTHAGETVCRSYSGHLNEKQHEKHKKVSQEQMLVLVHYVTRSFDDYISRKLPRPSGIYAHTFNRMSRSKSASKMSNETLFDRFEEEQHFNGQDPVCSSLINHKYALLLPPSSDLCAPFTRDVIKLTIVLSF